MDAILAATPKESEKIKKLLGKNMPLYRKAYSDRTAWLMACFSQLAYLRFNPFVIDADHKKFVVKAVSKLAGEKQVTSLRKLLDLVVYDHAEEERQLRNELQVLKAELLQTFDRNGTQAILVSCEEFIVLAFRGTEANSMKDIKADLDAATVLSESGGKMHTGFKKAFGQTADDIKNALKKEELKDKPLFITGHSLGGALATIAAKELSHAGGIAACYTFGSPRVGDDMWVSGMKTPVYRVVNAVDCVTMLPPGGPFIAILRWLCGWLPVVGGMFRAFLARHADYAHAGDMRYLTNCRKTHDTVKLMYSVGIIYRVQGWWRARKAPKGFVADHSIAVYRSKLMIIANRRNSDLQD